jgi:hypothetical protein
MPHVTAANSVKTGYVVALNPNKVRSNFEVI